MKKYRWEGKETERVATPRSQRGNAGEIWELKIRQGNLKITPVGRSTASEGWPQKKRKGRKAWPNHFMSLEKGRKISEN